MRLDKNKFVSWLKARPPAAIVGENRGCTGCPIANFYCAASGGHEVVIFERWEGYFIDRGYSTRLLPAWAERFVIEVDGSDDGRISARRALEVLTKG